MSDLQINKWSNTYDHIYAYMSIHFSWYLCCADIKLSKFIYIKFSEHVNVIDFIWHKDVWDDVRKEHLRENINIIPIIYVIYLQKLWTGIVTGNEKTDSILENVPQTLKIVNCFVLTLKFELEYGILE